MISKAKSKKLSRYLHTQGCGRLSGGYLPKKESTGLRFKIGFLVLATAVLLIGVISVLAG